MIEPVRGATLVSAVEANDGRDNRTPHYPIARAVEQATRFIESSLEPGTMAEARQRGAAMTLDEAIELALEPS